MVRSNLLAVHLPKNSAKMELPVVNNKEKLRFEVACDNGEFAYIEYRWYHGDIAYMHTVVPDDMQGKGIASMMARAALDYAAKEKLRVMVYCPYVAKYIKEHPEYSKLIDTKYTGRSS